jgi:antitoxin HigA-1
MKKKSIINVHPREILAEEFLLPLSISAYRLAKETGISESNLSEILHGKRSITVSISLRLGKFFELNPSFWIGLQNDYDLRAEENKLKKEIKSIKSYRKIINKKLKSKAVA